MITKFDNFLNEYNSSKSANNVPDNTIGFRYSDPHEKFDLVFVMDYYRNIENVLDEIFDKYNIKYDNLKITKRSGDDGDIQIISLNFTSYSKYEAESIIMKILGDLVEEYDITIYPETVSGAKPPIEKKPIGFGR